MYKNMTKGKNRWKIPLHYTKFSHKLSFEKHKPGHGQSYRRQVVHPRPQMPQREPFAKAETLLLIILSLVHNSDIKQTHCISSNPLFKKNVRGQKHPRNADKCRNSIPNTQHFRLHDKSKDTVQENQCPERAGHHSVSLPRQLEISI